MEMVEHLGSNVRYSDLGGGMGLPGDGTGGDDVLVVGDNLALKDGTVCDDLRTLSDDLAMFTPDGAVHVFPSGAIKLVGTDDGTNVFELPAAGALNPCTELVIVAPAGSKVLINVQGPYVQFVGMDVQWRSASSSSFSTCVVDVQRLESALDPV